MLYMYNCPGVEPGIFTFEVDSPNSEEVLNYATQLFQMGLPLDGDQLYEVGQLKKPTPGSTIVSKMGAMQPAAVDGAPEGVPVAGAAGGDPNQPPPDQQQPPQEQAPVQQAAEATSRGPARPVRSSRGVGQPA
jgi:hypothetical protein